MFNSAKFLTAVEDFRNNPGQLAAYESTGHCVVLAGPGSGKTKTLTLKMARMLAEDVHEPRGIACITYNNECARELESRLAHFGIQPNHRVFIGTVHSFSLTQIVIPYEKPAGLNLPVNFKVARASQQSVALRQALENVMGRQNSQLTKWRSRMEDYRRSNLDRTSSAWRTQDATCAALVLAYETELRKNGLIDFEDMPLLAYRALNNHEWVRKAVLAKYPILVVDEYQDLGKALHNMVLKLCFETGIRLFAVGDADQSIYSFTGADPKLLQQLSTMYDVETIKLPFNYRCGSQIAEASQYVLGEQRGYQIPDNAKEGTVYFHPLSQDYGVHADYLFSVILPEIMIRAPNITLAEIGILYQNADIGNEVASAASDSGIEYTRSDRNALYPRHSHVMRWLELCAMWSCNGWQIGEPSFAKIIADARRLFSDVLVSDELRMLFQKSLISFLWNHKNADDRLYDWFHGMKNELLDDYLSASKQLSNDIDILKTFVEKLASGGPIEDMTLGQFAGLGKGSNRISLSTLHSAKGREFRVVCLFGMDQGVIPWHNAKADALRESQRLFYVGFTRAEQELHIIYSRKNPSQFVKEVQQRLQGTQVKGFIEWELLT